MNLPNPDKDENFFRDSANQLIHTILYLNQIPTVVRGIVPISYSNVPDYCQKFKEQSIEIHQENEVIENYSVDSFKIAIALVNLLVAIYEVIVPRRPERRGTMTSPLTYGVAGVQWATFKIDSVRSQFLPLLFVS
jgi:hypothetical protein